jgi:hypothetical protein
MDCTLDGVAPNAENKFKITNVSSEEITFNLLVETY